MTFFHGSWIYPFFLLLGIFIFTTELSSVVGGMGPKTSIIDIELKQIYSVLEGVRGLCARSKVLSPFRPVLGSVATCMGITCFIVSWTLLCFGNFVGFANCIGLTNYLVLRNSWFCKLFGFGNRLVLRIFWFCQLPSPRTARFRELLGSTNLFGFANCMGFMNCLVSEILLFLELYGFRWLLSFANILVSWFIMVWKWCSSAEKDGDWEMIIVIKSIV